MMTIPVQAIPNQTLQVQLAGQNCTLNLYQTTFGLFMDVLVGSSSIANAVIAENLNRIVRYLYLGFIGDFIFEDTQGTSDPVYTGLGTRYKLIYLEESDLDGEG